MKKKKNKIWKSCIHFDLTLNKIIETYNQKIYETYWTCYQTNMYIVWCLTTSIYFEYCAEKRQKKNMHTVCHSISVLLSKRLHGNHSTIDSLNISQETLPEARAPRKWATQVFELFVGVLRPNSERILIDKLISS